MNSSKESHASLVALTRNILAEFGLKSLQITPLALPWYNNFLFKIDLAEPAYPDSFPLQPGTAPPPPSGISTLVLRFSNPHAKGHNNTNRVENIVASQYLVRKALDVSNLLPLVPAIYAWAPYKPELHGELGYGWMLDEFRAGIELTKVFQNLTLAGKKDVIEVIADIFSCIQSLELPPTITKFGGLTFDEHGQVIQGQMPILKGGPWESYAEVWHARLRGELKGSDKEGTVLLGWRPNGVRDRIERFLANDGIAKVLDGVDINKRVLVHGDFSNWNILFDPDLKAVTALLDFDWASITHPCHEYFGGFSEIDGGIRFEEKGLQYLAKPVLSGDFTQVPQGLSKAEIEQWELAHAWDAALRSRGVTRLSSIDGLNRLEDLRVLSSLICPRILTNPFILKRTPREVQETTRAENEGKLLHLLDRYGF
ncbi:hypothetical protein GQ53DRAFT_170527 [Thozetella sp. PMI_491]|nr:hypothetical protein GQ53DRAFT_170527 [Thozetella sp. PMI_491]